MAATGSAMGILLAASGSVEAEARWALDRTAAAVAARYPEALVRWAYTAGPVRRRMAAAGLPAETPAEALRRMDDEGVEAVAVASLHVIAGMEYDELREAVARFRAGALHVRRVALGLPLLAAHDDLLAVRDALLAGLPARPAPGQAAIFIGHGNRRHPADLAYLAAAGVLGAAEFPLLLGTVRGKPDREDVVRQCRERGIRRAWLLPFTTLAGRTVREVVAEPGPANWPAALAAAGIATEVVMQGLLEYDGVSAVWLAHLAAAVRQLDD